MAAKTTSKAGSGKVHIKWVRSAICAPVKHKLVVKGLGFTRLNQVIERPDTPAIRGMVKSVGGRLPKSTTAAFAGNGACPLFESHRCDSRSCCNALGRGAKDSSEEAF